MRIYLKSILCLNIWAVCASLTANSEQMVSSLDLFATQANQDHQNHQDISVRLSILIATIEKRAQLFDKLYQKLLGQLKLYNLEQSVEILFYQDNQTVSVGKKRNCLVQNARGEYVCFLDDDDDVSNDYLKVLYEACASKPDCVSCMGIFYVAHKKPRKFVHSLKYKTIFLDPNGVSCSPVYHINPVRREIALQVPFPEQNRQEDDIWSKQLQARQLLKTEVEVSKPYYFYYYNPNKQT